jgi:phosphoglycolate phosphatase
MQALNPVGTTITADAFVFDIDGTLLNTRDLVHWNALHLAMLEVYGVDTTIEGIPYHGMTDLGILRAAILRAGVNGSVFEEGLTRALKIVCREVSRNAQNINAVVCASILDVLPRLNEEGTLLGVASGNLAAVGWKKLESCQMAHFFRFGCFSDQCEERRGIFKSAVEEVRSRLGSQTVTCFIGDTPADVLAARAVGAKVIAVTTGTFSREQLQAYLPDACVDCCSEIFAS